MKRTLLSAATQSDIHQMVALASGATVPTDVMPGAFIFRTSGTPARQLLNADGSLTTLP